MTSSSLLASLQASGSLYLPLNDFGPAMAGMVIGGLGIIHVFLAQFAIGGGMLLCYFEWLAQTGRSHHARRFLNGYFQLLVLISFVLGALTGVGMWLTSIQVSPRTIGLMVDEFHWIWAIEWTFFTLEVVAGYTFYRTGKYLSDKLRLRLLILYSLASFGSLFWINGILSWQLTPGAWLDSGSVWGGFFNPSFWPSLLFRTVVSTTLGALMACVVINIMGELSQEQRQHLLHRVAHFLAPMAIMPIIGLWYLAVIPADSRSWLLGGSIAMTLFLGLAVASSALIGGYAAFGLWRRRFDINGPTAALLVALALGATAGGEFVREGARKPFTVRNTLYSNAIAPAEVASLRVNGSVTDDPYPIRERERFANKQLVLGARVYRRQCSVCHTINGANGVLHLAGSWTPNQIRLNLAKLQHTKAFMPPFAGNADELEALVQLILWERNEAPSQWPLSPRSDDKKLMTQLQRWLDEAGIAPGSTVYQRLVGQEIESDTNAEAN